MVSRNSSIRVFPDEISRVMSDGSKVVVIYTRNGKVQPPVKGKLASELNPDSKYIDLDLSTVNNSCFQGIPVSSEHFSIQKVTDENGRFLYINRSFKG
jgi:hypothetical protein